jgi:hypothetical protein
MKNFNLLFIFLLAAGCTTLSKKRCESLNYYEIGYDTSIHGNESQPKLDYYQNICATQQQAPVNADEFNKGYADGLKRYCLTGGKEDLGITGRIDHDICAKK